jgi:predicted nucleic acid-binding protein
MILDSSFLIDLLQGQQAADDKLDELNSRNEVLLLPAVVLFELYDGARTYDERTVIRHLEEQFTRAGLTANAEKQAARISNELYDRGQTIGTADLLIAGIAIERDEPVLTADTHFQRIDQITIEGY